MRFSLPFVLFVLVPYVAVCAWISGCSMPGGDWTDRATIICIFSVMLAHVLGLKFTYRKSSEAHRERLSRPQDIP